MDGPKNLCLAILLGPPLCGASNLNNPIMTWGCFVCLMLILFCNVAVWQFDMGICSTTMGWIIYLKTVKYHLYGQVLYVFTLLFWTLFLSFLCCRPSLYQSCFIYKTGEKNHKVGRQHLIWYKMTVQAVYSEVKPKKEFCPPHPGFFR